MTLHPQQQLLSGMAQTPACEPTCPGAHSPPHALPLFLPLSSPGRRSSSPRTPSRPAPNHSGCLLTAPSVLFLISSQLFAPIHNRIKKPPCLVTAPTVRTNSLDPVRLQPQQQPSASPAHPFLHTRGFQQHVSIPVWVSIAQINSPDTCALALPATIQCCSYKWQSSPTPRSSCIWRDSCNSCARPDATLQNLHL